ncbi:hypothetical protein [Lysinibacillus sphaericus]|uniref:hypothetical protein n=1 Tax=Lysinibacillus sphaericus TaxID=1421 RepID=UPI00056A4B0A|nr:hypothetical protein [Lysinibacillus sphaericus]
MTEFKYVDCFDEYDRIMQFNKNKNKYIHGWYPFVEGYSKEFIESVINELDDIPTHCLDPFSGSGTTAMELQKQEIKCTAFEVNPFMYHLSKVKMRTDYTLKNFNQNMIIVEEILKSPIENIESVLSVPSYKSIVERDTLEKWIYDKDIMKGLLDIKYAISQLSDIKYRDLFNIALAPILLEVSNVYRNGKCLSYKKKWSTNKKYNRYLVHELFLNNLKNVIYPDIKKINTIKKNKGRLFSNYKNLYLGDSRKQSFNLEDNSIDLVITSPPYLNSRDYTDTYMIELWMLDYIRSYDELKNLRKNTFRSHVQVAWGNTDSLEISVLNKALNELENHRDKFWNKHLLEMIKGYFLDMDILLGNLYSKLKTNGRIYLNVANSAYYGVEIEVDKIIAEIGYLKGFEILEIRKARKLNPSSQQKEKIPYLLEVVIVMKK